MAFYFDPNKLQDFGPKSGHPSGCFFSSYLYSVAWQARLILTKYSDKQIVFMVRDLSWALDDYFNEEKRNGIRFMKNDSQFSHLFRFEPYDDRYHIPTTPLVSEEELLVEGGVPTAQTISMIEAIGNVLDQGFWGCDDCETWPEEAELWAAVALACIAESCWWSQSVAPDFEVKGTVPLFSVVHVGSSSSDKNKKVFNADPLTAGRFALEAMTCIGIAEQLRAEGRYEVAINSAETNSRHNQEDIVRQARKEQAKAAAQARHSTTNDAIQAALKFYCEHLTRYQSKEEAADDLAEKSSELFGAKLARSTLRRRLQGLDCASIV